MLKKNLVNFLITFKTVGAKCYIKTCDLLSIAKDFVLEKRFGIKCDTIPYCQIVKYYMEDLFAKNSSAFSGESEIPDKEIKVVFSEYYCQKIEVETVIDYESRFSAYVCQKVEGTLSIPEVVFSQYVCHKIPKEEKATYSVKFENHVCHKINTSLAYNVSFSEYACAKILVEVPGDSVLYNEFTTSRNVGNSIKFGYLYNGLAIKDPRKITSSDKWDYPTLTVGEHYEALSGNLYDLAILAGGMINSGDYAIAKYQALPEDDFWNLPTPYAENLFNLNLRGTGYKNANSTNFTGLKGTFIFPIKTIRLGVENHAVYYVGRDGDNGMIVGLENTSGNSIRLVRNATVDELLLDNGDYTHDYIGNDGRRYKTVKIGNYVWLAEPLMETLYRNFTPINLVDLSIPPPDPYLLAGERYEYNNDENNVISLDITSLVPQGWHIPTINDLMSFMGNAPELINLDSLAYREANGNIVPVENELRIWLKNTYSEDLDNQLAAVFTPEGVTQVTLNRRTGLNIRLVKDDDGTPVSKVFTDREGNTYPIGKFGNKGSKERYWLMKSLIVKTYEDGTDIPEVNDNAAWSGLNDGAFTEIAI